MTRVFDGDRPAHIGLPPLVIAKQRSERLADPIDRAKFMDAFAKARVAESRGDHRLYHWYRAALDADDSVVVAGYIEGAASAHTGRTGR
uniref:Uncharacterized protein n=1 Tax=Streptomyces phage Geonosis TaxID=3158856 RepID=A0AAU7H038_9CAUD